MAITGTDNHGPPRRDSGPLRDPLIFIQCKSIHEYCERLLSVAFHLLLPHHVWIYAER